VWGPRGVGGEVIDGTFRFFMRDVIAGRHAPPRRASTRQSVSIVLRKSTSRPGVSFSRRVGFQGAFGSRARAKIVEDAMRRLTVGLMGMAVLLGSLFFAPAFGAPTSQPLGLRAAEDTQSPIQDVQFLWNGLQYCWFDFGWRGPGWYVCDYGPWVTGRWWGGPSGFRGWSVARGRRFRPAFRRQFAGPSRPGRPEITRPSRPGRPGINVAGPSRPGRPGINQQVTGPSTQGRPGRGPGAAAAGTVGRGPGGGGTVGLGSPGRGRGPGGGGGRRRNQ
jgi:hypothetical protein